MLMPLSSPPEEISSDLALNRTLRWIDRPREDSAWLWIGGKARSGKSELLREVATHKPDAIILDCAGINSEEIARKLANDLGVESPESYDRNFAQAAAKITGDPVVLLANTQWSGTLRNSFEPQRVLHQLVRQLTTRLKRRVKMRLIIEVENSAGMVAELRGRDLTLRGDSTAPADTNDVRSSPDVATLQALALAPTRSVPLHAWPYLCSAMGLDVSESHLEALASDNASDVTLRVDTDPIGPCATFGSDAAAAFWRASVSRSQADRFHTRALALLCADELDAALSWYAQHATAGHAVAAGRFEALLGDMKTVARITAPSLFEALEVEYAQKKVPQGTLAANLHHLAERGVWPSSHGEWLSLLHQSLMYRSASGQDLAARLAGTPEAASMPWRTLWSVGTGPDLLSTDRLVVRPPVRELTIVRTDAGNVAVAHREEGPAHAWVMASGTPLLPPADAELVPDAIVADQGLKGWRPPGVAEGYVDMPRMPRHVTRSARAGELAVLASEDGVSAVEINPQLSHSLPSGVLKRLLRTNTRMGRAAVPAEAARPTTRWLEAVWGQDVIRRIAPHALPAGISDPETRRFLSEIGFPCVRGFLELDTSTWTGADWHPVDWPAERTDPLPGSGPYFSLGKWQWAELLLDGSTGFVVHDNSSELGDGLAASSLQQFVVMARLYYWWYASDWYVDVMSDLRSWLAEIDLTAYEGHCWQRVFDDYNFEDRV
ncbi:SUKH-4 family immunity protein [Streptomyces sp. NPDC050738]|uniref:SUKH-4 family immunity protein n=1 Tax=Streptomyces sp. NPDC050738 TaxID=3154744 RepID=UPI003413BF65